MLGWLAGSAFGCAADLEPPRSATPDAAVRGPSAESTSSHAAPEPALEAKPVSSDLRSPLERAFPTLAAALPRLSLGTFPTPVEPWDELGKTLGVGALYVKRDDRSSPRYGGGKVRKLELFLADAEERGARRVATIGARGSNHALATAIYARQRGLNATLLLLPEPPTARVLDNARAAASWGAELRWVGSQAGALAALEREATLGAYPIPTGGTSPLGDVGFVHAGFELAEQIERGVSPLPDRVYIALGTMGSAIGLAIGLAAAGVQAEVVAVRASNVPTSSQASLERAFAETAAFLHATDPAFPKLAYERARLRIEERFLGRGYAQPTEWGARAGALSKGAGLPLEPTYTEKAFAALVADAPDLRTSTALFWATHHVGPVEPGDAALGAPAGPASFDR